jgi:hypothetical protein
MKKRESHIFDRDADDWYQEPHWVSERLFETENFGQAGATIWDPCCGEGRILESAFRAGYSTYGSDVVDRRKNGFAHNFEKFDFTGGAFSFWLDMQIVTNPPFDQIQEVAEKCVYVAKSKVALICPVRRLNAAHSWLKQLPLSKVLLLTPRPSMPSGSHIAAGGKVGGGTVDFCWLIFDKSKRHPNSVTTMDWLHRDAQ